MSKSITEKELAEKLFREWTQGDDEQLDGGWGRVARKAAQMLGAELADEKPEPGIYLTTHGVIVNIDPSGDVVSIYVDHDFEVETVADLNMGELRPARVISEQEWTNLNAKDEAQTRVIRDLRQARDEWEEKAYEVQAAMIELKPADEPEDERIEAWHEIARHPFFKDCYPHEAPLLDSMMEKLTRTHAANPKMYLKDSEAFILSRLDNARHGQAEVTREQVRSAVRNGVTDWKSMWEVESITDSIMELLKGQK